ncbi:hypothetical protein LEMLEM_LOCUS27821, partial [Lemmus lemmus]
MHSGTQARPVIHKQSARKLRNDRNVCSSLHHLSCTIITSICNQSHLAYNSAGNGSQGFVHARQALSFQPSPSLLASVFHHQA